MKNFLIVIGVIAVVVIVRWVMNFSHKITVGEAPISDEKQTDENKSPDKNS